MAEVTKQEVHRELDEMVIELEEIIKTSQKVPPLLAATSFHSSIENQAQRRLAALRAARAVWAMRPRESPERKVPPLQEELLETPAPEFLDTTATMLLQVTNGCDAMMAGTFKQALHARVVGDRLDNVYEVDIDSDSLVRGDHEMILCFDRLHAGDEKSSGFALNLANVVALARIGAQSLLNV